MEVISEFHNGNYYLIDYKKDGVFTVSIKSKKKKETKTFDSQKEAGEYFSHLFYKFWI